MPIDTPLRLLLDTHATMNSLKVPESGLVLSGPSDGESAVPPHAFVVSLGDDLIDQLIQSAHNGDDLYISMGKNPVRFPALTASFGPGAPSSWALTPQSGRGQPPRPRWRTALPPPPSPFFDRLDRSACLLTLLSPPDAELRLQVSPNRPARRRQPL